MELKLVRESFYEDRVIGKLYTDGTFFSHTLEDTDRGLSNNDPLLKSKIIKIAKRTAIPYGRYRVILSYSIKLKRYLPLLLDIDNFRGVRIHRGSAPLYTNGCILVGMSLSRDKLSKIKEAEESLIKILDSINKTEAIYITIVKDKHETI